MTEAATDMNVVRVPAYTRKTASNRLSWKRDRLEKVAYEPDNSRIGKESYGLQSIPNWDNQGTYEQVKAATLKRLIQGGVADYLNMASGVIKQTAVIGATIQREAASKPLTRQIGCETRPAEIGTAAHRGHSYEQFRSEYLYQKPEPKQQTKAKQESEAWRKSRTERMQVWPNPWK